MNIQYIVLKHTLLYQEITTLLFEPQLTTDPLKCPPLLYHCLATGNPPLRQVHTWSINPLQYRKHWPVKETDKKSQSESLFATCMKHFFSFCNKYLNILYVNRMNNKSSIHQCPTTAWRLLGQHMMALETHKPQSCLSSAVLMSC